MMQCEADFEEFTREVASHTDPRLSNHKYCKNLGHITSHSSSRTVSHGLEIQNNNTKVDFQAALENV